MSVVSMSAESVDSNEAYDEERQIRTQVWQILREQALDILKREPCLAPLINEAILDHASFGDALMFRLATKLAGRLLPPEFYMNVFRDCWGQAGTLLERLAMEDMIAVEQRDPACRSIAQVFLYFKGFKSIQVYRFSHVLWSQGRRDLAMVIQARNTEVFGVDIHPGARIGGGLMIDHGTGVVIGETAVVGTNCSFLHGTTLGGTGTSKDFDRHPKIGNNVFLGCGVTVLGNIKIGDHAKVGAGSLVLKPLPAGCVAVGSPAVVKSIDPQYAPEPGAARLGQQMRSESISAHLFPNMLAAHQHLVDRGEAFSRDPTPPPPAPSSSSSSSSSSSAALSPATAHPATQPYTYPPRAPTGSPGAPEGVKIWAGVWSPKSWVVIEGEEAAYGAATAADGSSGSSSGGGSSHGGAEPRRATASVRSLL